MSWSSPRVNNYRRYCKTWLPCPRRDTRHDYRGYDVVILSTGSQTANIPHAHIRYAITSPLSKVQSLDVRAGSFAYRASPCHIRPNCRETRAQRAELSAHAASNATRNKARTGARRQNAAEAAMPLAIVLETQQRGALSVPVNNPPTYPLECKARVVCSGC